MDQQQNYVFNLNYLFSQKINRSHLGALIVFYLEVLRGRSDGAKRSLVINHSMIYNPWKIISIHHSYNNELFLKHNRNRHSVGVEPSVVNVYPHQLKHRRCGL